MSIGEQRPNMHNFTSQPDLSLNERAETIYRSVKDLSIISPHGHTDPKWFAGEFNFEDPAELLIVPDHYVFRMLYSQGVQLTDLGIGQQPSERNPRTIFQLFADHWHKFVGTPSHLWVTHTLREVFDVQEVLNSETAMQVYEQIDSKLSQPDFSVRSMYEKFNIALIATTDGANDDLAHHQTAANSDWSGKVVPTFRPDSILDPDHKAFSKDLDKLADLTGEALTTYDSYLCAIQARRSYFAQHGATATDHALPIVQSSWLDRSHISSLFDKARAGKLSGDDAQLFYSHMITEMAQMSVDDGLVMQLHAGSKRSTNRQLLEQFGADVGADIPLAVSWVTGLDALLNRVGNDSDLHILAFTLDETTYARELAPMVGHWPALRLGPPWWFHDSPKGIARYLEQVVETAGYWNLAGFNDDTRAFASIPARHDMWRKGVAMHLDHQVDRGVMSTADAMALATFLSRDVAIEAYKLKGL